MVSVEPRLLDWGVDSRPLPGESVSGDAAVVSTSDERALVAAVDGLGHGAEAAHAAEAAAAILGEFPDEPVESLVGRCHAALAGTRGAAISLASFSRDAGTMTWLGVGNVEGRLLRPRDSGLPSSESLMLPGGLVGDELPRLAPSTLDVQLGDTLIFATDGLESDFGDSVDLSGSAEEIAARLLRERARPTDDALVVVARYVESGR